MSIELRSARQLVPPWRRCRPRNNLAALDRAAHPPAMSLARRVLLRASRSTWLAEQLRRRAFFRRATRRFMPGEELDAALAAAQAFAAQGIGSVLTELGEQVTTPAE